MTLFFIEKIVGNAFVGPAIIATPTEQEAWGLLAGRERKAVAALREDHRHTAQDVAAMPDRPAIVSPGHSRRAIV